MLALVERATSVFTPKALEFGADAARLMTEAVYLSGGGEIQRPQRYRDMATKYATVPWVFAAVRRKANDVSSVPLRVTQRKGDTVTEVERAHPLRRLLARVNDFHTQMDLIEGTSAMLDLAGNSYWLLFDDQRERPAEIWHIRPELMSVIASPTDFIAGYKVTAGREEFTFPARQVLHFKEFNPLSDYYGLGGLTAAWNSAVVEEDAQTWNRNVMRNAGRLDGILKSDQPITETQAKEHAARFREIIAGPKNAGRVLVTGRGLDFHPIATTPKELDFVLSRKLTREEILAVLGVRPVILGLEAGDIGRRSEQIRDYFYSTVRQRVLRITGGINEFLVPRFKDEALEVAADLELALMPYDDRAAIAEADGRDVQNRILTPNEVRRRRGLAPIEGGDVVLIPNQLIPVAQAGQVPVGAPSGVAA